jgi:glycosyltransferase involved in cell wall biosynthesis
MHILFLTDNFPPEVNAPASRTFEHCREWVKAGKKVTVVTCAPNFPKGRVFDGYCNRLWQSEEMEGIRVIRVWTYISANAGFMKRILDYISFMIAAVLASPFIRKVDIVIGTSPQFFTACAAFIVSGYKRVPFVFELRDIWPESIKAVGAMKPGWVLRLLEWLEQFLYRRADRIICVTNSFKRYLTDHGIDPAKVEVVTNGINISYFTPQVKDAELASYHGLQGKFVAGYIGTHGMAHALETVLEAAKLLQEQPDGDRFRILLLGDGAMKSRLISKARDMKLENIVFVDTVPKDEVVKYWALLDASIIHLRHAKLFEAVIPSKLFESMGMGIPVLHGVAGESAQIVRDRDVGLVFDAENAEQLCENLRRLERENDLYQRLQSNALKAAKEFDRSVLATRMLDVIGNCLSPSTKRRSFSQRKENR